MMEIVMKLENLHYYRDRAGGGAGRGGWKGRLEGGAAPPPTEIVAWWNKSYELN